MLEVLSLTKIDSSDLTSRWSALGPGMTSTAAEPREAQAALATSLVPVKEDKGAATSYKDNQWLLLRLDRLAIIDSITFGKCLKPHPCNVKEVEVYAGPDPDRLALAFRTSLKNDTQYETIPISNAISIPCRYVKIVPISSHSANYNVSIWHVALQGRTDESLVEQTWHTHAAVSKFRNSFANSTNNFGDSKKKTRRLD